MTTDCAGYCCSQSALPQEVAVDSMRCAWSAATLPAEPLHS